MKTRAGALAIGAAVLVAGASSLARSGYSPDEEFTLLAVRGITAHGLPVLPSGLLYDRGLAYSYLGWIASAVSGLELPAFRALALGSAVGALALLYALGRRAASAPAAWAATVLVSASIPFWAVATTGRFYAPFLASWLGVLLALTLAPRTWRALAAIAVLSATCRLTHELAFTLLAAPVAGVCVLAMTPRAGRAGRQPASAPRTFRDWASGAVAIGAGLAIAQVALFAMHYAVPAQGGTMIKRFFLWQVLNLFERPDGVQVGVVVAALVVAWIVAPARGRAAFVVASCGAAMATAFVLARASIGAPFSADMALGALAGATTYPLDMFWSLAAAYPVLTWLGLALIPARLAGAGGEWPASERAVHLAWVGWVLWFGVIDSGITTNYMLLPVTGLFAALGVDLVAIAQHARASWPGRRAWLVRGAVTALALLAVATQGQGGGTVIARFAAARPTIDVPGIGSIREGLEATDRVACTDELACLILVGRVDRWLALDAFVRERFLVAGASGPAGVYAGAPAVFDLADLFAPDAGGVVPARVVVVDVFKEYPVGNSRTWLPRALAAVPLDTRTLLETPQARVVEISRPRRNAGLSRAAAPAARP